MNREKYLNKIKEFEGFRAHAYKCPAGVWTIGYGRTSGVTSSSVTSRAAEEAWFNKYVEGLEKEVSIYMEEHGYAIVDYQLQALTSFIYNLGYGKLMTLTENGKRPIVEISKKIPEYCYAKVNGKKVKLAGLERRRAWEKDLFDGKFETSEVKTSPTAKDLQELCNEVSGSDLVIDGKIGKKSVTALYNYIKEVSK
jgi:lysozyme